MQRKFRLLMGVTIFLAMVNINAQQLLDVSLPSEIRETVELVPQSKDIWSLGLTVGYRLPPEIEFEDRVFNLSATVDDSTDFESGLTIQLSFKYRLDNYLIPGISAGLTIDYYNLIINTRLQAFQGTTQIFDLSGGFLTLNSIGVVPIVDFRVFTLIDYFFKTNLPTSWDIFIFSGVKFNINQYSDQDVDVEDLDTLVISWEVGGGAEVFLSDRWSLKFEFAFSDNDTDFEVTQQGFSIFTGNIDLQSVRMVVGFGYYF